MTNSPLSSAWLEKYQDFPLLQVKPCPMDDSDVDFHSDLSYCRELMNEIHLQAISVKHANPFPIVLSDELDHALAELKLIKERIREFRRG